MTCVSHIWLYWANLSLGPLAQNAATQKSEAKFLPALYYNNFLSSIQQGCLTKVSKCWCVILRCWCIWINRSCRRPSGCSPSRKTCQSGKMDRSRNIVTNIVEKESKTWKVDWEYARTFCSTLKLQALLLTYHLSSMLMLWLLQLLLSREGLYGQSPPCFRIFLKKFTAMLLHLLEKMQHF